MLKGAQSEEEAWNGREISRVKGRAEWEPVVAIMPGPPTATSSSGGASQIQRRSLDRVHQSMILYAAPSARSPVESCFVASIG